MIKYLLALLLTIPYSAFADSYGYIRVKLLSAANPDHTGLVRLNVNGQYITQFSHSQIGMNQWMALQSYHLRRNSGSSPVTANYGNINNSSNGVVHCEFDYAIEFSMDGHTIISSFSLHAPTSGSGSIPLGLGCNGDDHLCSTDRNTNNKIIDHYNQITLNNYNNWKAEYDARIKDSRNSLLDREQDITQRMERDTVDLSESQQLLENKIKEWNQQTEDAVKDFQTKEDAGKTDPQMDPAKTADEAVKDEQNRQREQKINELQSTLTGNALSTVMNLQRVSDGMISQEKEYQAMLKSDADSGEDVSAQMYQSKKREDDIRFINRQVFHGEGFVHIAKRMTEVGLIPMNSYLKAGITLCEIATGREFCIGGQVLNTEDRIESACNLLWKNAPGWKHMAEALRQSAPSGDAEKFISEVESRFRSGKCKEWSKN